MTDYPYENNPQHSIKCCMCPDDVYKPIIRDLGMESLYWCRICGYQLRNKRVDLFADWKKTHPEEFQ